MTNEDSEMTRAGLAGKIVGNAKEIAGSVVGNDDLAREGRLQQAQVDAEADAERFGAEAQQRAAQAQLEQDKAEIDVERRRLENEVAAQEREDQIKQDHRSAEHDARVDVQAEQATADRERQAVIQAADDGERRAERERIALGRREVDLEQEARRANRNADAIDPEENR